MRCWRRVAAPHAKDKGSVAIIVAIALPVLLGMTAIAVEGSSLLLQQRRQKAAADAAALSASVALTGKDRTAALSEASASLSALGYGSSQTGVNRRINVPPTLGSQAGNPAAVEVIVTTSQQLNLAGILISGSVDVAARAVAVPAPNATYCLLSLHPSAPSAVALAPAADLAVSNCGVAAKTSSPDGFQIGYGASITGKIALYGGPASPAAQAITSPNTVHSSASVSDPYALVVVDTALPCTSQPKQIAASASATLISGRFCGGLQVGNNAVVTLAAGVYVIDSLFQIGSKAVIKAIDGVTIVMRGNFPISIASQARLNIVAPGTGPTAGIAVMAPSGSNPSIVQAFANKARLNITGALYFPDQKVVLDAVGPSGGGCLQVIGRSIAVQSSISLDANCVGTGVKLIQSYSSQLVE